MTEDKKHDCQCGGDCGHDHDHKHEDVMDDSLFIDMELEDGSTVSCEVLGTIEIEGKDYIAVLPEESETFWVYQYEEQDDSIQLDNITDEDEFKKVVDTFEQVLNEEDEEEYLEETE